MSDKKSKKKEPVIEEEEVEFGPEPGDDMEDVFVESLESGQGTPNYSYYKEGFEDGSKDSYQRLFGALFHCLREEGYQSGHHIGTQTGYQKGYFQGFSEGKVVSRKPTTVN